MPDLPEQPPRQGPARLQPHARVRATAAVMMAVAAAAVVISIVVANVDLAPVNAAAVRALVILGTAVVLIGGLLLIRRDTAGAWPDLRAGVRPGFGRRVIVGLAAILVVGFALWQRHHSVTMVVLVTGPMLGGAIWALLSTKRTPRR